MDIAPEIFPFAQQLTNTAYFVPDTEEYLSVLDLTQDLDALDSAREFLRQKGRETLEEATKLDKLYRALREQRRAASGLKLEIA